MNESLNNDKCDYVVQNLTATTVKLVAMHFTVFKLYGNYLHLKKVSKRNTSSLAY